MNTCPYCDSNLKMLHPDNNGRVCVNCQVFWSATTSKVFIQAFNYVKDRPVPRGTLLIVKEQAL